MFAAGTSNEPSTTSDTSEHSWLDVGTSFRKNFKEKNVPLKKVRKKKEKQPSKEYTGSRKKRQLIVESHSYLVDTCGDPNNVLFRKLYPKDVSRYSSIVDEEEQAFLSCDPTIRYFTSMADDDKVYRYSFKQRTSLQQLKELEFIPLEPLLESKIETKNENTETYSTVKSKEFNVLLRKDPDNINLWQQYIKHQENIVDHRVNKRKLAIFEKQRAILMKAKAANPGNGDLDLMNVNLSILQRKDAEVADIFEAILEKRLHTDISHFMQKYIQWKSTQFPFTVSTFRDFLVHCNELSIKRQSKVGQSSLSIEVYHSKSLLASYSSSEQREESIAKLRLIMTAALLERVAGYCERGLAVLQALIELNLYCPTELRGREMNGGLELFETFWDSEAARFGEKADGSSWTTWYNRNVLLRDPCLPTHYADLQSLFEVGDNHNPIDVRHAIRHWILSYYRDFSSCSNFESQSAEINQKNRNTIQDPDIDPRCAPGHGSSESFEYRRILKDVRGDCDDSTTRKKSKKQKASVSAATDVGKSLARNYYRKWIQEEEYLQLEQWLPLRGSDMQTNDQSDRVLFFEELRPIMCRVDPSLYLDLPFLLLDYVGVHFSPHCLPVKTSESSSTFVDEFCSSMYPLSCTLIEIFRLHSKQPVHYTQDVYTKLKLTHREKAALIFSELTKRVHLSRVVQEDPSRQRFCRLVLLATMRRFPDEILVQRRLMEFECEISKLNRSVKAASYGRQAVKLLVEQNHNDVQLWCSFAEFEFQNGNFDAALRICDKTISLLDQFPTEQHIHIHELVFLYARLELWYSNRCLCTEEPSKLAKMKSIYILSLPFIGTQFESARKIEKKCEKAGESYASRLEKILTSSKLVQIQQKYFSTMRQVHSPWGRYFVPNFALFQYLSCGVDQAFQVYDKATSIQELKLDWQWIFTCYLELMEFHCIFTIPVLPQKHFRSVVQDALKLYPKCGLFLRLFIQYEQYSAMSQVLRLYFQSVKENSSLMFDSPSAIEWLFALVAEVGRCELESEYQGKISCYSDTSQNRIRNLFDECLESNPHFALFWRLYLRFEVLSGQMEAAKKVFFRSIHCCPWSKEIVMDGIRLQLHLTDEEATGIVENAFAKELFLRNELE